MLYKLGAILISPWNPKAKAWLIGRKGLFEKVQSSLNQSSLKNISKTQLVWMHCASLGEYEQGRPILEAIKNKYPNIIVVVSFFSPSGFQNRGSIEHTANFVYYLPPDHPQVAKKWLDLLQPSLILWVKYEYWHYYLSEIKQRKIPLLLVSGIFRPKQIFFRWYGGFYRNMLTCFTQLFVQNEESKKLVGSIGLSHNVTIGGDTRFDRVKAISAKAGLFHNIERQFIGNAAVIVAGSTWKEDEEEINHYANAHPEIKFIIAPHNIEESRLKETEKLFRNSIRYSKFVQNPSTITQNVLIIDNIGMLSSLYQYASIAYVGGGFGNEGVHNVLEAAVYHKPVVLGPEYEKYAEAVDLVDYGGAFSIQSAIELEAVFDRLLTNKEAYAKCSAIAGSYVAERTGATEKILNFIQEKRLLTRL